MHHKAIFTDSPDIEISDRTKTKESASRNEINEISEKIMIRLEELKHQELYDRIQLPKIRKNLKAKELMHKGNTRLVS